MFVEESWDQVSDYLSREFFRSGRCHLPQPSALGENRPPCSAQHHTLPHPIIVFTTKSFSEKNILSKQISDFFTKDLFMIQSLELVLDCQYQVRRPSASHPPSLSVFSRFFTTCTSSNQRLVLVSSIPGGYPRKVPPWNLGCPILSCLNKNQWQLHLPLAALTWYFPWYSIFESLRLVAFFDKDRL